MVGDRAVAVDAGRPTRGATPIASRTSRSTSPARPLRLDIPPLGPGRGHRGGVHAADGPARRGHRRAGADREVRPARPAAPRVGQTGTQTLWVHPRVGALRPLPVGFAKDLEGPTSDASPAGDVAFHALPRVRARRRPPPHPLDVDGPHRHADGPPLRRQPPPNVTAVVDTAIDSYRSERRVRRRHRDRRLARRVVLLHAQPVAVWLDREVVTGPATAGRPQRPARPPDAGRRRHRHRRGRRRAARPAGGGRHVGARRDHRQRADRPLPAAGHGRPPLGPRGAGAGVAARRPPARRLPGAKVIDVDRLDQFQAAWGRVAS